MLGTLAAVLACLLAVAPPAAGPEARHAQVRLVKGPTLPSGDVRVALVFEVRPGFHIYHENPGDSGMPPTLTWTTFAAGAEARLEHPKPKKHVGTAGTDNVHEGTVALLTTAPPAAKFADPGVTLTARVDYLVCDDDRCLSESADVALKLSDATTVTAETFAQWEAAVAAANPTTAPAPQRN